MSYRNGTYVAFHAEGSIDPTASDIKYYRMLLAWHEHARIEFKLINSHEKAAAVRDTSSKETLRRSLRERLNNSRNMILIVGDKTRFDTDWVPFEISYAVDQCKIPLIVTYPGYTKIMNPPALSTLWPEALIRRAANNTLRAIHIPFCREAISDAIQRFDHNQPPPNPYWFYSADAHRAFGLAV